MDNKNRQQIEQMYGLMLQIVEKLDELKWSWVKPVAIIVGALIAIAYRVIQLIA